MSENFDFDEQQGAPEEETPQPQAEEQPYHTAEESSYQPTAEEQQSYPSYNAGSYPSYSQPTYQTYTPNYSGYAQNNGWSQPSPPAPQKPKKEKKGFGAGKVVALGLCCAIIGGAMGFGGALLGNHLAADEETTVKGNTSVVYEGERETNVINTVRVDTNEMKTAAEVYAENVNSTVGITTSITTNYWGYQTTSAASGSGFILTEDGYLLTNYHVVEGSNSIKATMYDGTSYDATLIGYDASNDIAVLKIEAQGLTPVVLGDSDNMNVGDPVVAIGNPLGELTFSLTQGAISALDREVTLSGGTTMNLMQTDCAINSGNSGGALFNLYGEVVGITNAKYSSNSMSEASIDNIGFAIPINSVRSIVESIIENGYIAKPYIGVTVSDVSEEMQSYGLPKGAAIKGVVEGSPAEKAGLKTNDIITAVNGEEISGQSELVKYVKAAAVGDKLKLTVYRQGETLELTVTVGEQVQSAIGNTDEQETTTESQGYFPWGFGFGN
ncbi:MAG: S1C family serine protease [Faecousia sp.]